MSPDHKVVRYFKTLTLFFPKYVVHKVVLFESQSRVMTSEKK
ncbi:hypothetical protein CP02DC18_0667 [Chlamydia psittaci 02DC18]|nr:hypothetical protein CP02DC18_0667 [Chlamydia psittaci 02DC18]